MGEVIIELPFDVQRKFRILNTKAAVDLLYELEDLEKRTMERTPLQVTDTEVLNVWAGRTEESNEIARQLRHGERPHRG